MQWDRWIKKRDFRSETKPGIRQSKKSLFDPIFFDRAIRSAHPIEKVDFFDGIRGSVFSIAKVFEAQCISHHPTKHTITPYYSSDTGLTATILLPLPPSLLLLLLTTTRRATSFSQPASSACFHPMAAVRVSDGLFATPLLLLCSLWRLSAKSKATTATMKRMTAPRTPNEHLWSRKRRDEDASLSTASGSIQIPSDQRAGHEEPFQLTFTCPTSTEKNAPERALKTK